MPTLLDLYKNYCEELNQYDNQSYPEGQEEAVYHDYEKMEGVKIDSIDKDGRHIGFLITFARPGDEHELLICEAYIIPEFRKHGFMREAVKEAIRGRSMIRFVVFNDNPAIKFWEKVMQEAGYRRISREKYSPCLYEYFYKKEVLK